MLTLQNISLRVAGRLLIEKATLSLPSGFKTGFVGLNGTGKTSLFRAIKGDLALEEGEIIIPPLTRIGQVMQEAPSTDEALIDLVLAADKERTQLLREAAVTQDGARIGEIHTRLADIDAHSAPARAATILAGLGFDEEAQRRPVSILSGGWRMRVALACVLFSRPDLLLLDEPTNYLDLEGTIWLQDYIRHYPSSVLIISHDRELLNHTVHSILHLDRQKLTLWRGGYDQFQRQRFETMALQQKQAARQQEKIQHMQAFVERFRAKATKARQAQSRLKALAKLTPVSVWQEETCKPFRFTQADKPVASPIITLSDAEVGYAADKPVLRHLNLRIDHDDRIALLGSNGNGKSTFAKLLAGRLSASKGTLTLAPGLKTAFFAQHQIDDLRPQENAIEHLRHLLPQESEAKLRARIAQMGLSTQKMLNAAQDLSGGEKARLLMGLASYDAPHLLILDEPTNHLDIDSRAALIEALNEFNGAVVLISHDRHLIEACAERLWLVAAGTVTAFEGDLEEYRTQILGHSRQKHVPNMSPPLKNKDEQRRLAAQQREQLAPLRKQIQMVEKEIEHLQNQICELDKALSDGALYMNKPEEATEKAKQRAKCQASLTIAEGRWLELGEQLDSFTAVL